MSECRGSVITKGQVTYGARLQNGLGVLAFKSWLGFDGRISVPLYLADFSLMLLKMVLHICGKLKQRGVYEPIGIVFVHVTEGVSYAHK